MATEAQQIKAIQEELERFTENAVIDISLEISDELQQSTPVLTGHLKSNWITSVGSFSAIPAGSPDNPTDSAQAAGETRLLSYKLEQGIVYITNSVAYAGVVVAVTNVVMAISSALLGANLGIRRRR